MRNAVFARWTAIPDNIIMEYTVVGASLLCRAYILQNAGPVNKVASAPSNVVFGEDLAPALAGAVLTYKCGAAVTWDMLNAQKGRWFFPMTYREVIGRPIHEDYLDSDAFTQAQKDSFRQRRLNETINYHAVSEAIGKRVIARVMVPEDAQSLGDCSMWGLVNPTYGFVGDVGFEVSGVAAPDELLEWN